MRRYERRPQQRPHQGLHPQGPHLWPHGGLAALLRHGDAESQGRLGRGRVPGPRPPGPPARGAVRGHQEGHGHAQGHRRQQPRVPPRLHAGQHDAGHQGRHRHLRDRLVLERAREMGRGPQDTHAALALLTRWVPPSLTFFFFSFSPPAAHLFRLGRGPPHLPVHTHHPLSIAGVPGTR